jgi:ribosomal protein S18 acetylase RimI-like enzyme
VASDVEIKQATIFDLEALVPLFDAYRVFYRQASDPPLARGFLRERFEHAQSTVFIAWGGERALGFTQLYPMFSSLAAARSYVLYDLFVVPEARKRGIGAALLRQAVDFGRAAGAVSLSLSTAVTNHTAQALYEAQGWRRDAEFYSYDYKL